jgi:hypothetical protein
MPEKPRADDVALEFARQLITLSSGVVALSATFIEKLVGANFYLIVILALAWIALLTSIVGGLQTISAIVGSRLVDDDEWSTGYGRRMAALSKWAFITGISLIAIFAFGFILGVNSKVEPAKVVILNSQTEPVPVRMEH